MIKLLTLLVSVSTCLLPFDVYLISKSPRSGTPQEFGIIPTRSKSCDVIQQALDRGGTVVLSEGTYTCQVSLVITRDNTWLRGQGGNTILQLADKSNAPVIVIGQTIHPPVEVRKNVTISDLVINGNRKNQDNEFSTDRPWLRNNGITIRKASDITIQRVQVYSARSGGLVTELGCKRIKVNDFTSFDNEFDGIAGYETEESIISNVFLYDNLYAGFSFDIRFDKNVITNAVLSGNRKQGIFMRDSRENLFTSIQIRNSGEQGVFLAQVDTDQTKPAIGNSFIGLSVTGSVGSGFRVNDASCVNNLVCGGQFFNNAGGAISQAIPSLIRNCENVVR